MDSIVNNLSRMPLENSNEDALQKKNSIKVKYKIDNYIFISL